MNVTYFIAMGKDDFLLTFPGTPGKLLSVRPELNKQTNKHCNQKIKEEKAIQRNGLVVALLLTD